MIRGTETSNAWYGTHTPLGIHLICRQSLWEGNGWSKEDSLTFEELQQQPTRDTLLVIDEAQCLYEPPCAKWLWEWVKAHRQQKKAPIRVLLLAAYPLDVPPLLGFFCSPHTISGNFGRLQRHSHHVSVSRITGYGGNAPDCMRRNSAVSFLVRGSSRCSRPDKVYVCCSVKYYLTHFIVLWRRIRQLAGRHIGAMVAMLQAVSSTATESEAFERLLTEKLVDTLGFRARMPLLFLHCTPLSQSLCTTVSNASRLHTDALLHDAVKSLLFQWEGIPVEALPNKEQRMRLLKSGYASLSSDVQRITLAAPFVHFSLHRILFAGTAGEKPKSPFQLVCRLIVEMDANILRTSMSHSARTEELFEAAWQNEFYRTLYKVAPHGSAISPNFSDRSASRGYVDFHINGKFKWAFEITRGKRMAEHVARFQVR